MGRVSNTLVWFLLLPFAIVGGALCGILFAAFALKGHMTIWTAMAAVLAGGAVGALWGIFFLAETAVQYHRTGRRRR
jgi:Na+/proline symporter